MKVFVMRHGTTVWNEKGITQGHSNNRLSARGKDLSKSVSIKFKDEKFDVIFSSPLMRTMQTSKIMNEFHNVKIVKDNNLIEIDQGIFVGREKSSLNAREQELKDKRDSSCGLESYENVYFRVKNFLDDLKKSEYKNVLIITHAVVATMLEYVIQGKKVNFNNVSSLRRYENAEIKSFDF